MARWMWAAGLVMAGCAGKNQTEQPPSASPGGDAMAQEEPAPAQVEEAPTPNPGEAPPDPDGGPQRCGGIAGFQCPDGEVCGDDPSDSCRPGAGGADCMGLCMSCDDRRLSRTYVSRDPAACSKKKLACGGGKAAFNDHCGCGCYDL